MADPTDHGNSTPHNWEESAEGEAKGGDKPETAVLEDQSRAPMVIDEPPKEVDPNFDAYRNAEKQEEDSPSESGGDVLAREGQEGGQEGAGGNTVPTEAIKGGSKVVFSTTPTGMISRLGAKVPSNQPTSGKAKVKKSGKDPRVKPDSKTKKVTKVLGKHVKPKLRADMKLAKSAAEAKKPSVVEAVVKDKIKGDEKVLKRLLKEKKDRREQAKELNEKMAKVALKGTDETLQKSRDTGGKGGGEPAKEAKADDTEAGMKAGWIAFESEAERLAFLSAKKLCAKAKARALKQRQRQRVGVAPPASVAAKPFKPAQKSSSNAQGPAKGNKVVPKHPKGATSLGKNAGGKDKSNSKPKPIGATSSGKRAGDLASYNPEPKKLKGQMTKGSDVDEQMKAWLETANEAEMAEAPLARAGLLTRHGPRTVSQLASMSDRMQDGEGRNETQWSDSTHHPSASLFLNERRLRYYSVDPNSTSRVASLDTEADADLGQAAMEAGSLVFHSSLVADLERSVDQGENFSCHQCSQHHSLIRSTTTVLLTENEQLATFRSPWNCTKSDEARPKLPKAGSGTHCEVLLVPSGLKGGVIQVFEAVYAQHKGNLRVILNLGDGAIRDGESVDSVKKQLMVLGRQISAARPKSERELTKVLIPLSLTSKDGRKVVLSSWDNSSMELSTQLRHAHLNILLRNLNTRLGHISGEKDQESAVLLDTTFFKESLAKSADGGGRIVEKVSYLDQGNHLVDIQGRLHPTKEAIFLKMQDLILYFDSNANRANWGIQHFF